MSRPPESERPPEELVQQLLGQIGAKSDESPDTLLERSLSGDLEPTAHELLQIAIMLRNIGRLPLRHSFFPIAMMAAHVAEDRINKMFRERYAERFRELEKIHGLEPGEYWPKGEEPAEHEELSAELDQASDAIHVAVLREYGELAMADLYLNNREEYDRLYEIGRRETFGPLPRRPVNRDDE